MAIPPQCRSGTSIRPTGTALRAAQRSHDRLGTATRRRTFLHRTLFALALLSAGNASASPLEATPPPPAAPAAPATPAKELHVFCWTEYIPQSVVDMFTAETGIRVFIENYSSNEELLRRRLAGGRHDLVQPSDYAVEALIKADRLEPLDHSRLPNLRNLDPAFTGLRHDPEGRYSVPWMAGTVGIVYNTEKISEPISSLHDAFSGAYTGRIVALGDSREWATWALRSLGLPINDLSPAALDRVRPVFQSWMPQVLAFDSDSPHRALLDGRADVGIVWSGEAAVLLDASPRFRFVLPAEGAHRFIDCLAIPKGARHRDHAHTFIDFILRPETGVLISEEFPYTNPNAEARKRLRPEQLRNPASYPPPDIVLESLHDAGDATSAAEKLFNDIRWTPKSRPLRLSR